MWRPRGGGLGAGSASWFFSGCLTVFCGAILACAAATAQEPDITEVMPSEPLMVGKTPFTIQGFGNIDYVALAPQGSNPSFVDGAFEFFVASRLSDHWTVIAELVFEPDGNTLSVDLERFQITYELSDAFRISAGRVHNPIMRWAVTNHHGLFMETPVANPIIARWEDDGGLWPLHFVGLVASGRLPGPLGIFYTAGVGNGRGQVLDEVQVGFDANNPKAVVTSVGFEPDAVPGLQVFASGYFDQIPAPSAQIREQDVSASVYWLRGPWEFRSEWSLLHHTPHGSPTSYDSHGFYVLGSYGFPVGKFGLRPYLLLDYLSAAKGEAYLEGAQNEKGVGVGLRFDMNRWLCLKGEYRAQKVGSSGTDSVVRFQLAANF